MNFPDDGPYNTVAIFFLNPPPEDKLQLMMERALSYKPLKKWDEEVEILKFRLVKQELKKNIEWENTPTT